MISSYSRVCVLTWLVRLRHLHPQMTFAMQAQLEDIHIAMYPNIGKLYQPEDPDTISHPFASTQVNMGGVHVYSATSKVWSIVSGMSGGLIMNQVGVIAAMMEAPDEPTNDGPSYLAKSLNTTTFRKNRTYEVRTKLISTT